MCLCTVLPPRGPRHTQWKHSPLFSVSCKRCSLEPPSKRSIAAIHHTLELFTERMITLLLSIKNTFLGLHCETESIIRYSKLTINMTILKKKRALISGKTWILRRTVIAVCTVTTEGTGNAVTPRFTSALRLAALGDAFCRSYYCCSTCLKQQYVLVVLRELGVQSTTHQSCLKLFDMVFFLPYAIIHSREVRDSRSRIFHLLLS